MHWYGPNLTGLLVAVTFAWVSQNLPGMVALTPGVDLNRLLPQN